MTRDPQLEQLLADLGKSADEVAATLQVHGIQGVRNTVRFLNPIVRYMQTVLRTDDAINLMEPGVLRLICADGRTLQASLPPAVVEFLQAFNRGAYRDLELPNA